MVDRALGHLLALRVRMGAASLKHDAGTSPEGQDRLHSFRHFFCSVSANAGVPEQVLMEWLGHRDSSMVRHYYHLHQQESQRQMQRINFLSAGVVTGAASARAQPA